MEKSIKELQRKCEQYAIEHITGKGLHKGVKWLADAFNELSDAIGVNEYYAEEIGFEVDELIGNIKKSPWVSEIAAKSADRRTLEDIDRIVGFITDHWLMRAEEVTTKDVSDVLLVADPLSHRHILAQKIAIDCIHALDRNQMAELDKVLAEIAMHPSENNQLKIK